MKQDKYVEIMEQAAQAEKEKILETIGEVYKKHPYSLGPFLKTKSEKPSDYENLSERKVYESLGVLTLRITLSSSLYFFDENYIQSAINSFNVLIPQISNPEIREHISKLKKDLSDRL